MNTLIKISREEADKMRQLVPDAHIAVVNRHHKSKQKTYFIEENRSTIPMIKKLRGIPLERKVSTQKWR